MSLEESMFPLSGVLDGVGLNLTVMSYCGGLDVGIVADREIADDLFPLADAVARALDELVALLPETGAANASRNGTTTRRTRSIA